MEYNIYRLMGGIKPVSFQLPLKETFVKRLVDKDGKKTEPAYKRIVYIPGTDSFYLEDHKGDLQPQSIWFEYGDVRARKDDKLLNDIMKNHPWYGKRYKLYSEEAEEQEKLESYRFKSQARQLIEDADEYQIKAIALAIFGQEAGLWNATKCELKLREKADDDPKALKETMDNKDYSARLLAGMAFVHGIVEENRNQTAVVWTDSDGIILKLAKGEKGINELGRFLSTKTTDSELVLQSIGERLEKIAVHTGVKDTASVIEDKDAEIERLKALLNQKEEEDPELIDARAAYEKANKKAVPNNMKNNLEWLKKHTKS